MEKLHHVYVLYKRNPLKPIYIGVSCSLKTRISKHKKNKYFDGVLIIESFKNKEEALSCERVMIKFFSAFKNESIINGLYANFHNMEFLDCGYNSIHKINRDEL
jgi:predicted GIY-YIG superfamily endonuclease